MCGGMKMRRVGGGGPKVELNVWRGGRMVASRERVCGWAYWDS